MSQAFDEFLKQIPNGDLPLQEHLLPNRRKHAALRIWKKCRELEADLLVVGSRGHSALSSLLLGSLTEKLLTYPPEISYLIYRDAD